MAEPHTRSDAAAPARPSRAELQFYATPGPMTALGGDARLEERLAGLPRDPEQLRRALPGLVIHGDLQWVYGLDRPPDLAEMNLRPASAILGRVLARDDGPLERPRAPQDRMVGVCRHYATLFAALLRHQGTPARARCGFGGYFAGGGVGGREGSNGEWIDHWVTEYWDAGGERWVRADPQFDDTMLARLGVTEDPADLRPEAFLTGGDAWLGHRWGSFDAQRFGIADLRGPWFVAGNVVRDLAALNKVEVLPWDVWGPLGAWIEDGPDDELVDALAVATTSGSLDDVRAAYRSQPWLPVSDGATELVPVREG
jgi:hypothetical protein